MQRRIKHFVKSEDGAVTVDWVVLTAVLAMMGAVFVATMNSSLLDGTQKINVVLQQVGDQLP